MQCLLEGLPASDVVDATPGHALWQNELSGVRSCLFPGSRYANACPEKALQVEQVYDELDDGTVRSCW